jgi:AraC-like DNA-binding protein
MHCIYIHFDLLYDPARSHWDVAVPGGKRDLGDWRTLMHPPLNDPTIDFWRGKLEIANPAEIKSLMQKICLEHSRQSNSAALQLSGLMIQIVAEIIRGTARGESLAPLHWDAMQQSLESIQKDLVSRFSVEEQAAKKGLSSSHFRKLFREVHGQSARSARRNALMQKARELLLYSDLSVSEIADRLGFSTVHNFSRAFRSMAGISPRQYRQGNIVRWS